MAELAESLAVHKALADASRMRALHLLTHGELCLCELIQVLGLAPSTVSRHMSELQRAGLVVRRKEGRWHFYRLPGRAAAPHVREAIRWVHRHLGDDPRLHADAAALKKVKRMDADQVSACY